MVLDVVGSNPTARPNKPVSHNASVNQQEWLNLPMLALLDPGVAKRQAFHDPGSVLHVRTSVSQA